MFKKVFVFISVLFFSLNAYAADPFKIKIEKDNSLSIKYKSQTLKVKAQQPWLEETRGGTKYYLVNGDISIGGLDLLQAEVSVSSKGGQFIVESAPQFGDLSIEAGKIEFSLLPGDQIKDAPANAEFSKNEMVMLANLNTAFTLKIGKNTSIAIPTPGQVEVTLMLEFTKGTFYYEGPIPALQELAGGLEKFVKASKDDEATTLGLGYSVNGAFKYESEVPLYKSAKSSANQKFSCNLVLSGSIEIAEALEVDAEACIDTVHGKLGLNGAMILSAEVIGAQATYTVANGSVVVDKKGAQFGFAKTTPGMSKNLENILHFVAPMLMAEASVSGYVQSNKKFGIIMQAKGVEIVNGVGFKNLYLSTTEAGMEVEAVLQSKNLGNVSTKGKITDTSCWLEVKSNVKIFGFKLSSPRIKPCAAGSGAVEYAGKIAILGKGLAVKGVDDVKKTGGATLDFAEALTFKIGKMTLKAGEAVFDKKKKKINLLGSKLTAAKGLGEFDFGDLPIDTSGGFKKVVHASKKIEYGKKIKFSGGSVSISGLADVGASFSARNGRPKITAHVKSKTKARFCVKVKFAGFKTSKCDKISINVDEKLKLSTGCFRVSAKKKILGKSFRIPRKDICIGKDKDAGGGFTPDKDSVAYVVYLQAYNGKYVYAVGGGNQNSVIAGADSPSGHATFVMYNKVPGSEEVKKTCPVFGSSTSFRTLNDQFQDRFLRLDKKLNALDAKAKNSRSSEQAILESAQGKRSGQCISDGDVVYLKSQAHGSYWTTSPTNGDRLFGVDKLRGDRRRFQKFTIHLEPK
ncbi:MAG: hypothetical protein JKY27_13030 [Magnetovibrio sp.]|nr:hypothetical protein [Magnetovibrio sp.]